MLPWNEEEKEKLVELLNISPAISYAYIYPSYTFVVKRLVSSAGMNGRTFEHLFVK